MFDKNDKCMYIRGINGDDTIYILQPCPICGKKPKVKIDQSGEYSGFGGSVIIKCKPFLRKEHIVTKNVCAMTKNALRICCDQWNDKVSNYNKPDFYEEEL